MNKFEKVMVVLTAIVVVAAFGFMIASWGAVEWSFAAIIGVAFVCHMINDWGNSNTIVIEIVDERED